MGEEEKKQPEADVLKPEEGKEEPPKAEPAAAEATGDGEKKEATEAAAPPPPPEEVVLLVDMHCQGCARKVRRSLKGFTGVEDVKTDCKTKVVVKGKKAAEDPMKVLERIQKKTGRKVELLSALPPPKPEPKLEEVKVEEAPKPVEKKVEPPVIIEVVLRVHMHCLACAHEMKKRILKMKGVQSAEPDLNSSQVTVKGVFDAGKLVEHVYKRTGKHAVIIKQELAEKPEESAEKGKEETKAEAKTENKAEPEKKGEGGEGKEKEAVPEEAAAAAAIPELKRNEYMYYYPRMVEYTAYPPQVEYTAYPPQVFSDENPNACSLM